MRTRDSSEILSEESGHWANKVLRSLSCYCLKICVIVMGSNWDFNIVIENIMSEVNTGTYYNLRTAWLMQCTMSQRCVA